VATLLVCIFIAAGTIGWVVRDQQSQRTVVEREILRALGESTKAFQLHKLTEAEAALKQAESILSTAQVGANIEERVVQWKADLDMVNRLESVRLDRASMAQYDKWDFTATPGSYKKAFAEYGLDFESRAMADVIRLIQGSEIKSHLIAAIDDWATLEDGLASQKLKTLASIVDNNRWRTQLRNAIHDKDTGAIKALADDDLQLVGLRGTVGTVVNLLRQSGEGKFAIDVLRRAQRTHPTDFWINYTLGMRVYKSDPYEAIGYLTIAVAQRPNDGATHNALGNAFFFSGEYARAEVEFRAACQLQPDRVWHHSNHVDSLVRQGKLDEAEAKVRNAMCRFPDGAQLHCLLGHVLGAKGKDLQAAAEYWQAYRLDPLIYHKLYGPTLAHELQRGLFERIGSADLLFLSNPNIETAIGICACRLAGTNYKVLRNGDSIVAVNDRKFSFMVKLASSLAEVGDFGAAEDWLRRAAKLKPEYRVRALRFLDECRSGQHWRQD
jgi:Flp pilus assembly protein TadD